MNQRNLLISDNISYFRVITKKSLPARYQHLAEDIAQDAMVKCIAKIDLYDSSKGNFRSWMYRLTQNLCFDAIRKHDKLPTVCLSYDIAQQEDTSDFDEIDKIKIRKVLRSLSERDRKLIMLKFYFNYSGKEISEALGIPERQVASYFRRAKLKFKTLYGQAA